MNQQCFECYDWVTPSEVVWVYDMPMCTQCYLAFADLVDNPQQEATHESQTNLNSGTTR